MTKVLRGRGTAAIAVGGLTLLVAGGGYAIARGGATIKACVTKSSHVLYTGKCKKHDSKLSWSKVGPTGKTGAAGAPGAPGPAGPTGPSGIVSVAGFAGDIGTITGSSSVYVFAGSPATVTTAASQIIIASASGALGTSAATANIALGLCVQPSAGGTLTLLDTNASAAFEALTVTMTRSSFAIAEAGSPGAGTWRVGMCVKNGSAQSLDNNDFAVGWAQVTGGTLTGQSLKAASKH